jgi:hypothetical protein
VSARLPAAWYVLLYHEVAWEAPPQLRGIGGMVVPPDRLRDQLERLADAGRLIGVTEALERLRHESPREPWISFWFDDGYAGVRRYAAPLLADRGVGGAMSVCSRFATRREMYWRAELAWLAGGDGLRFVRSRLRRLGIDPGESLRETTLDRFSPALRDAIAKVMRRQTPPAWREDAFRMFDDVAGLRELARAGWRMTNHSAAHWPIGESAAIEHFDAQFEECARTCAEAGLPLTADRVLPFDRVRDPGLDAVFEAGPADGRLVLVGNRTTSAADVANRRIYRIVVPPLTGDGLLKRLAACAGSGSG